MTDQQYNALMKEIRAVKREAANKGHFLMFIMLLWIIFSMK